eukprot:TRINITY_DN10638_c0_g1_i1.p1 TRINITY_DN10638_c0_g1~~TRINITY_DN10638_c0_g1_i1.p1  ORF type:complete len:410 (-),score=70.24 TRINITY_DN10638_c0_g1_i1:31-1101(-)
MPVGTQGTMKGLTSSQVEELGAQIILGNTYHLGHRPGPEVMAKMGGLHKFMSWKNNLLTDSGGFQMVSLLKLAEITEEGVKFESPHDGTELMMTPEKSMEIQNAIGADIMMALDDVVHVSTRGERVVEALHRTLRWIDRCVAAHSRPTEQNLFPIVQGGLDVELRKICVEGLVKRNLPGYAIGGLSGGESKDEFWRVVSLCTDLLPKDKPRYLMGVGFPVDLVVCVALGVDMFDCVYPTRTARFGTALVDSGTLSLRSKSLKDDYDPLDSECSCSTCKNFTRAYLYSLPNSSALIAKLLTIHNIAYQLRLMRRARQSILENRFPAFVRKFMELQYPKHNYPNWVVEALASVKIELI